MITVLSKAEASSGGLFSCGSKHKSAWEVMQFTQEGKEAEEWFAALLKLNPWYLIQESSR